MKNNDHRCPKCGGWFNQMRECDACDSPVHDPTAYFHEHLDGCWQCREHPHALCAEGARRLYLAAGVMPNK